MAKKNFNELLQQKGTGAKKKDVTEETKDFLSNQTTGRKRKYTKLKNKENKTKIVTVLLTETEYNDLLNMCEKLNKKSVSECIRELIDNSLSTFYGKLFKDN